MNRWLCIGGTIMVVIYFFVLRIKFTEYKQTRNRALVFHTKQGIILHRKGGRAQVL